MMSKNENTAADSLVDIRDVHIKRELPQDERIKDFIRQVKNPYCFKVGSVVVNVAYSDTGTTLNDRFAEMLSML